MDYLLCSRLIVTHCNWSPSMSIVDAVLYFDCDWLLLFSNSHTHTFNGPLSGTTQVSRYQKGKTNLDFTGARDSFWQWHQLGHMLVCTSLQTDSHASTSLLSFLYRPDALPAAQPTASKHWRYFSNSQPTEITFRAVICNYSNSLFFFNKWISNCN